jgi:hypothetical protein
MTNDECRNFLIPDTHFQHIRATMGFCKWAAPTFFTGVEGE